MFSDLQNKIARQTKLLRMLLNFEEKPTLKPEEGTTVNTVEEIFDRISSTIQLVGLNLGQRKKSLAINAFAFLSLTNFFLCILGHCFEIFLYEHNLLEYFGLAFIIVVACGAAYTVLVVGVNRRRVESLGDGLRLMYTNSKPEVMTVASKYRKIAFTRAAVTLSILQWTSIISFLVIGVLNVVLVILFTGIQKYPYAFPMYWRMFPIDTPSGYAGNFIHYWWAGGTTILCYASVAMEFFACTFMALIWKADMLIDLIENMETDETMFENWLEMVMSLLVSIRRDITGLKCLADPICYVYDKISYMVLVSVRVIISIDISQVAIPLASSPVFGGLFFVVVCNEIVIQKFEDMNEALYNLSWYNLIVKKQKPFIILLTASQNTLSFTAGGIRDLTYDWITDIVKSSYSSALVILELLGY